MVRVNYHFLAANICKPAISTLDFSRELIGSRFKTCQSLDRQYLSEFSAQRMVKKRNFFHRFYYRRHGFRYFFTSLELMLLAIISPIVQCDDMAQMFKQAETYYYAENYDKALSILQDQKLSANPESINLTGEIYFYQDNIKALQNYKKAAELGNSAAMNSLASLYNDGWLTQKVDKEKARYWWEKAIENGDYDDFQGLYRLYSEQSDDYTKALKLLQDLEARNIGDDRVKKYVHLYLGRHYRDGEGVAQDFKLAEKHFKLAGKYGHMSAYESMCSMYTDEKYNNVDTSRALACYQQYNKRSEYTNFDCEIAHIKREVEYQDRIENIPLTDDKDLKQNLVGTWGMLMQHDSCRIKKILILNEDSSYSIHADADSEYTKIQSHKYGKWTLKDGAIHTIIDTPSLYQGRKGERQIANLSRQLLRINLVLERHIYERLDKLSEQEKLLTLQADAQDDIDITKSVIGRWQGNLKLGPYDIETMTTYNADGTFKVAGFYEDIASKVPVEIAGTWAVNNGHIEQQLKSAKPVDILEDGTEPRMKVLRITADTFTYFDLDSGLTVSETKVESNKSDTQKGPGI